MKKIEIDTDLLKSDLNDNIKNSSWSNILLPYINSEAFDKIINTLINNVNEGKRFTPKFKDIFNGFYECPYEDLKVVIVGQDPYPQLGVADGIAFSCSKKGKTEKSLQYIFKSLYGQHEGYNNDLRRWSNQGVLLINTAFTCEINKIGSHYSIWKMFTEYIFSSINKYNPNTIFILMGKKAESWQTLLPNCTILKCAHPASAAYRGGLWDSNDVFNKANKILVDRSERIIQWW